MKDPIFRRLLQLHPKFSDLSLGRINQLLKKIESENAYKIIEIDEIKDAPINYLKPVAEELA